MMDVVCYMKTKFPSFGSDVRIRVDLPSTVKLFAFCVEIIT